jgi:hypothetical protein
MIQGTAAVRSTGDVGESFATATGSIAGNAITTQPQVITAVNGIIYSQRKAISGQLSIWREDRRILI